MAKLEKFEDFVKSLNENLNENNMEFATVDKDTLRDVISYRNTKEGSPEIAELSDKMGGHVRYINKFDTGSDLVKWYYMQKNSGGYKYVYDIGNDDISTEIVASNIDFPNIPKAVGK